MQAFTRKSVLVSSIIRIPMGPHSTCTIATVVAQGSDKIVADPSSSVRARNRIATRRPCSTTRCARSDCHHLSHDSSTSCCHGVFRPRWYVAANLFSLFTSEASRPNLPYRHVGLLAQSCALFDLSLITWLHVFGCSPFFFFCRAVDASVSCKCCGCALTDHDAGRCPIIKNPVHACVCQQTICTTCSTEC